MPLARSTVRSLALVGFLSLPCMVMAGTPANSPLLHLAWSGCTPSASSNRDFSCDNNAGVDALVASYTGEELASEPPTAFTFRIVLLGGTGVAPSWWQTYTGGCRQGGLTVDDVAPNSGPCLHLTSSSFLATQQGRIGGLQVNGWIFVSQQPAQGALVPGETYFLANLNLAHTKSVGADSCAGCSEPMVAYFDELVIETATPGLRYTYSATSQSLATWQGSLVPTRNTTWGRIKSQYR
ncbi:MAG: hypothetical protein U0704_06255 [Candidatus Eisenbacteria bacterium]